MIRQIITKTRTVCNTCKAIDSFIQTCGTRTGTAFDVCWARCKRCRQLAQIRITPSLPTEPADPLEAPAHPIARRGRPQKQNQSV